MTLQQSVDICQLKMFAEQWKRDDALNRADYPKANSCFYEMERYKAILITLIDRLPEPEEYDFEVQP